MKKKVLACLTMLVLASLLAVSVFAATGGVSSLVLGQASDGVDYAALKTGQTFDVYLVVSPLEQAGANYIYRPNESTKGGKTITAANSDVMENVYTITWDDTLVELVTDGVSVVPGVEATASEAGTDKDGNTLYYGFMATGVNKQIAAEVATESGKATITYSNGTKFAGVAVKGRGAVSNAVVAKLTFRVLATTEGGDPAIKSADTYKIGTTVANATAYTGANGSVSVTVAAAGCLHTDTEFVSTKIAATCYRDGVEYRKCLNPECGETVEVVNTNRPAHNYKNAQGEDNRLYLDGEVADCTTGGRSALFCTNEGCGHCDESTITNVDPLGHDWKYVAIEEKTCSFDGVGFYYCSRCAHTLSPKSSPDAADPILAAPYYNVADGKFYNGAAFFGTPIDGSVCYFYDRAPGHNWTKDASGTYTCSNAFCDFQGEAPVSGGSIVRYVTTGGSGDGLTAETAASLQTALDTLAFLPEDVTGYLYIVDNVELTPRQASAENTDEKSFEEKKHSNNIVITTDPASDKKATVKFVENCTRYFLYGPTTFENIYFAGHASYAGDLSKEMSVSPVISARGFKLVLGENIEMLGGEFPITKNGVTFNMSDMKLFIVGGCIDNGLYEGFNAKTFTSEMEIYSGKYFNVTYFNLGTFWKNDGLKECSAKITYGEPYVAFAWAAFDDGAYVNDCVVTIMYKGAAHFHEDYRFGLGYNKLTGPRGSGNRADRLFYAGANGMVCGDAMMGTTTLSAEINHYYEVNLEAAVNMQDSDIYNFYNNKSINYNGQWPHTTETGTIVYWCGKNIGHDYVDDICTFCGFKYCKHSNTESVVLVAPTCVADGVTETRCVDCGVVLETVNTPFEKDAHDIYWDFSGVTPRAYCHNEGCTAKDYATAEGADLTNIYVSDKGTGFGGFSPRNPVNDFHVAMQFAALADGEVTIHVIGSITVVSNIPDVYDYYSYVEPKHENMVIIRGYGDERAVFELGGNTGKSGPVYNLSGPLTFENIELSTGRSLGAAGGAAGYIAARHNELVFGEKISADFNRGNSSMHMGNITVMGGCYRSAANVPCTDAATNAGAANVVNKLTFKSGTYQEIVGGNVNDGFAECEERSAVCDVDIRFEGEVNLVGFAVFGGFRKNCGDITVTLDNATLAAGRFISFGSENNSTTSEHTAGDVKIIIHSGFMEPSESTLGTFSADRALTGYKNSLTVCYDPTNASSKVLYDVLVDSLKEGEVMNTAIISKESYCPVTGGEHVGELLGEVEASCFAEGYQTYKCTVDGCGIEYTKTLGFADHTYGDATSIAATCVSPELSKKVCEVCNKADYTVVGTAFGDCVNNGAGVCVNCNADMTVGCAHTDVTTETTTNGCGSVTTTKCNDCQKITVVSDTTSHNYGPYSVTVEATETTTGIKTRTCKTCGKVDSTIMGATEAVNSQATATGADGNVADVSVETSKLTKAERAALNALLQETSYGSEVKVSYEVDGDTVTGITYYIPVPVEYTDMTDVKIVVKDDEGIIHVVDFVIEKGYFVFTF